MNASTDEYQYMPPLGEGNYIMPAPRDYFADCNKDESTVNAEEEEVDDSAAATAAAKWRRARSKIRSIQRIKMVVRNKNKE